MLFYVYLSEIFNLVKFYLENADIMFYFYIHFSKNTKSHNFYVFIGIPLLISQIIDHDCFSCDIAETFPYLSETPLVPCAPLLSHCCLLTPLFYFVRYLKTSFFTRNNNKIHLLSEIPCKHI